MNNNNISNVEKLFYNSANQYIYVLLNVIDAIKM